MGRTMKIVGTGLGICIGFVVAVAMLSPIDGLVGMLGTDAPLMQPDRTQWPNHRPCRQDELAGAFRPFESRCDATEGVLVEWQVKEAIGRFASERFNPLRPKWVLIGPGDWLLAGTSYRVVLNLNAPIPNIGIVKGYWGGSPIIGSVFMAKREAVALAAAELGSGVRP